MNLSEAIKEIKALHHALLERRDRQKYLSHHPIETKFQTCLDSVTVPADDSLESKKLFEEFQLVKTGLELDLKQLENDNEQMIKVLDFEKTCKELIRLNDLENFNELFNIGHYFGTGPQGRDVTAALERVYDYFKVSSGERNAKNKPCLDRLAVILKNPLLPVAANSFQMFADPREKVKAILKVNAVNDLMLWLIAADQDQRDFALRCAAAIDTCQNCLAFLLLQTAAGKQRPINLLSAGQPSGQTALHRAVLSKKTVLVSILVDAEINPSNDLLRQLLARDKDRLTPIDLIENNLDGDVIDCQRMLQIIKGALDKYQNQPRLSLTAQELETVTQTLTRIKAKVDSLLEPLIENAGGSTVRLHT